MEYKGKLYGHLGGKMYFDTGKTANDWDALEKRVSELEAENQALRQQAVGSELPVWAELLTEVRFRLLVDIDQDGEPRSSMAEIIEVWDKVNKALKTIGK